MRQMIEEDFKKFKHITETMTSEDCTCRLCLDINPDVDEDGYTECCNDVTDNKTKAVVRAKQSDILDFLQDNNDIEWTTYSTETSNGNSVFFYLNQDVKFCVSLTDSIESMLKTINDHLEHFGIVDKVKTVTLESFIKMDWFNLPSDEITSEELIENSIKTVSVMVREGYIQGELLYQGESGIAQGYWTTHSTESEDLLKNNDKEEVMIVKIMWKNIDLEQFSEDTLIEEGFERAFDQLNEGYTSGELNSSNEENQCTGWWSVV